MKSHCVSAQINRSDALFDDVLFDDGAVRWSDGDGSVFYVPSFFHVVLKVDDCRVTSGFWDGVVFDEF